jgi:sigma-B regulation protein RsbU (phosphoserine phosphatase)
VAANILIAHRNKSESKQLNELLGVAGYQTRQVCDLTTAQEALQQCPEILLLDIELLQQAGGTEKARFESALEIAGSLCLRLCAADADFSQVQSLSPFACGTVHPPVHGAKILEQIDSLLRIRAAETERNRAQEQLILHRMEVEEGLRSAAQIQHALLPGHAPLSELYSFAWTFAPCETVGGDLFNLMPISEDRLVVYIFDVSGHGVSSALVTVSVYQSLSDRTGQLVKVPLDHPPYFQINSPADVLRALDEEYPFERFEKFFTMTYMLLDRNSGRLCYANAGHPPPILLKRNGAVERLESGGTLVGLGGLVPYEEEDVELEPGDRVFLFSDGITEYEATDGEMFGEQRLIDYLLSRSEMSLEESIGGFNPMLRDFGKGATLADDISLFAIEYKGAPQA